MLSIVSYLIEKTLEISKLLVENCFWCHSSFDFHLTYLNYDFILKDGYKEVFHQFLQNKTWLKKLGLDIQKWESMS